VGTVCGKLLTMSSTFDFGDKPTVDSTGIFFTPNLRHLDRGSLEVDNGHFLIYEYVFGATAAAALYRREMIDDISIGGEFFDADFFVYREDADVAWRAQLLGWKCLYAPYAKGYHVRNALPGNRRALPAEINMHSVKNRFLLRMKNISPDLYRRNLFSITARDIVVVACCLVWEHSSLRAFPFLVRNWKKVMAKRREIMQRQRVDDEYMASWFSFRPVSKPAPKKFAAAQSRSRAARG
jgi:GT2 family glycosyltransferase